MRYINGYKVINIQFVLFDLGYKPAQITKERWLDGRWGDNTSAALAEFQINNKTKEQNGEMGPNTARAFVRNPEVNFYLKQYFLKQMNKDLKERRQRGYTAPIPTPTPVPVPVPDPSQPQSTGNNVEEEDTTFLFLVLGLSFYGLYYFYINN